MKEESHKEEMGLQFYGSGTPIFWLRLLLFIEWESRTPIFKNPSENPDVPGTFSYVAVQIYFNKLFMSGYMHTRN